MWSGVFFWVFLMAEEREEEAADGIGRQQKGPK